MIVGLASNSYFGGQDYLLQGCKGIFTEGERITFQFFELSFDNEELSLWKPKQEKISWQRDLTQIVK